MLREFASVALVSLVFGFIGAVFAWLLSHPVDEPLALPCAASCGIGWRGVEFSGGCACVQEVR